MDLNVFKWFLGLSRQGKLLVTVFLLFVGFIAFAFIGFALVSLVAFGVIH
jgi:hypothetical protein